jgi:acetyltransferase
MKENPLHLLMNPKSIAILGASNSPMKMGTMNALSIIHDGYKGSFYPMHRKEKTVLGFPAYASVEDLPEAPDLAMFVIPADQIPPLMEDFGKKGTRRAIVITAGFKETGEEGIRKERELLEIARRYGIRFVGPNCMGILNTEISLNTTVLATSEKPGLFGLASQSGTYITQVLPYMKKRGVRFSKAISVGNEADLSIIDAMEYLGEDEQTKAVGLYIEGIRDVPRFLESARRITPRKPVVAQYVGGSGAGARSGQSHTGAMAGPDYLYDGLFRQAGVIRVHSIEELFIYGWALAAQPPLKGKRIGIVTHSGGPGTAIANACEEGGCEVPLFSKELQGQIRPLLPPHAPSGNPVDFTFAMEIDNLAVTVPEMVLKSGEVDGVVVHGPMRLGWMKSIYPHFRELMNNAPVETMLEMWKADLVSFGELPYKYGAPMAISSFFDDIDDYTLAYHGFNIPVYDSPEKAGRAMAVLNRYREITRRAPHRPEALPPASPEASKIIREARDRGARSLDEHSAKTLLAAYGVPVTDERLLASEEEAAEAAGRLGYPLVMKACDPDILHKTEKGLVLMNLKTKDEAVEAFRSIQKKAGRPVPVVAYQMVKGEREFMAGMTRHPGFAPCVLFGLGGVFTEALRDMTFRVAPLTEADAMEMLDDIRSAAMLGAFRGMPPADRGKLASLLRGIGNAALLHPEIAEIDVNPVIVSGPDPVAVDALVVLAAGPNNN